MFTIIIVTHIIVYEPFIMKISCLAEQMRWMCGFSWAKRRQEAHIHNLRCGQKWSDHMQCVCSLVSCSFLCIHHTCVYSFLLQSRLYMNKHKRQLELKLLSRVHLILQLSSAGHFAQASLSVSAVLFHLQLSCSAADISTPLYFEMKF